jgi:hypothetical protein
MFRVTDFTHGSATRKVSTAQLRTVSATDLAFLFFGAGEFPSCVGSLTWQPLPHTIGCSADFEFGGIE